MYDDAVFADRFRCQLTMFEVCILIEPSQLLETHIAYEIDTAKIILLNFLLFERFYTVEFNRLP